MNYKIVSNSNSNISDDDLLTLNVHVLKTWVDDIITGNELDQQKVNILLKLGIIRQASDAKLIVKANDIDKCFDFYRNKLQSLDSLTNLLREKVYNIQGYRGNKQPLRNMLLGPKISETDAKNILKLKKQIQDINVISYRYLMINDLSSQKSVYSKKIEVQTPDYNITKLGHIFIKKMVLVSKCDDAIPFFELEKTYFQMKNPLCGIIGKHEKPIKVSVTTHKGSDGGGSYFW